MAKTLRDNRLNKITYISLGGAVIVIIAMILIINIIGNKYKNDNVQIGNATLQSEEAEEANSSIGKTVDESKQDNDNTDMQIKVDDNTRAQGNLGDELNEIEEETGANVIEPVETEENNRENQPMLETASQQNVEEQLNEEEKNPTFIVPVDGEIIKHYGKEKLIYSETLKEWTTHLGIDIKADKTAVVKASADGTVKSIKNDPRYGLTVVLEHQSGFTSVYANLLTAEFVAQGETVKAGQTLGTVGNSATFEILDDSHLHFEILKDGNNVDPEMYVK